MFTGGAPAPPPFIFFDLETTGLSGGAGTLAFLVGCGWFEDDGSFATRQFLLARLCRRAHAARGGRRRSSRALARSSASTASRSTRRCWRRRYLYHRMAGAVVELPHVDVLHPARRFWKRRRTRRRGVRRRRRQLLARTRSSGRSFGVRRRGDVPGFEIPGTLFPVRPQRRRRAARTGARTQPARSAVARGVDARLLHLTRSGPELRGDAREALALGHVYRARRLMSDRAPASVRERARELPTRARRADRRAAHTIRSGSTRCARSRSRAVVRGVTTKRRQRWGELAAMRGCPAADPARGDRGACDPSRAPGPRSRGGEGVCAAESGRRIVDRAGPAPRGIGWRGSKEDLAAEDRKDERWSPKPKLLKR